MKKHFKEISDGKKDYSNANTKDAYGSISNFFLSYKSILALVPLVEREMKIREFQSEEIVRVKCDYI
ncbi:MAG: hypothetical protein Q9M43_05755 [Sulfurimonas sp.]|nr:hypothetical protein [Sulfurimonas sp.]